MKYGLSRDLFGYESHESYVWPKNTIVKSRNATLFIDLEGQKVWKSNLKAYSKLLNLEEDIHKCLKAEILRYKGKFNKAIKMLKKIKHPDYTWCVNQSI